MRKLITLLLAVSVGVALGRTFNRVGPSAEAGGAREGQGEPRCVGQNGDVNADGVVDITDPIGLLGHLFLGAPAELVPLCPSPAPQVGLPATRQTLCWDSNGNIIDCADERFPGQDGYYQRGCNTAGRFIDHGDGTVTDVCTGLMWQKDTADFDGDGIRNQIDEDTTSWASALRYCESLEFAGKDDWRLPNIRELYSLVDQTESGLTSPPIDGAFGAVSERYWSSTTYGWDPSQAYRGTWRTSGGLNVDAKWEALYVRAVRDTR